MDSTKWHLLWQTPNPCRTPQKKITGKKKATNSPPPPLYQLRKLCSSRAQKDITQILHLFCYCLLCFPYLLILPFVILLVVILFYLSIFKYFMYSFYSPSCIKLIFCLYFSLYSNLFPLLFFSFFFVCPFHFPFLLFIKHLKVFWFYLHLEGDIVMYECGLCVYIWLWRLEVYVRYLLQSYSPLFWNKVSQLANISPSHIELQRPSCLCLPSTWIICMHCYNFG